MDHSLMLAGGKFKFRLAADIYITPCFNSSVILQHAFVVVCLSARSTTRYAFNISGIKLWDTH